MKESKPSMIARRGAQEHTCTRTTWEKEGSMCVGNGWEQLHVSEFPLHTRQCLMLPPLSLTSRLMVHRISRWWPGSFNENPPRRDFKPLDPVQTSGCEDGALEMFSFCDPLQARIRQLCPGISSTPWGGNPPSSPRLRWTVSAGCHFFGGAQNVFLGYRNLFGDAKCFFGIQKLFVDQNLKTSPKLQIYKNKFKKRRRTRTRKSSRFF